MFLPDASCSLLSAGANALVLSGHSALIVMERMTRIDNHIQENVDEIV
jgi:hypothetical protein